MSGKASKLTRAVLGASPYGKAQPRLEVSLSPEMRMSDYGWRFGRSTLYQVAALVERVSAMRPSPWIVNIDFDQAWIWLELHDGLTDESSSAMKMLEALAGEIIIEGGVRAPLFEPF